MFSRRPLLSLTHTHTLPPSSPLPPPPLQVLDYPRWHQRTGNHHIFRLFRGEENLWGVRKMAARVEAAAKNDTYYGGDPKDASTAPWHSFQGNLTLFNWYLKRATTTKHLKPSINTPPPPSSFQGTLILIKPVEGGTVFQGYNSMLGGWWADGVMTVDADGNSNVVVKERSNSKANREVSGSSLTGVPLHIVHRDNGFNFEVYVNGRLMLSASLNRNPKDAKAIRKIYAGTDDGRCVAMVFTL